MEIIHICPANFATGGTESIHQLVCALNKVDNVHAKILYVNWDKQSDPRPKEYKHYGCEYITDFPNGFRDCVIFPEVYGNQAIEPQYKDCVVAMNWAGVDVYDWNVPEEERGIYLQRKDMIHIARSKYAVDYLAKKGLKSVEVACTVSNEFFESYTDKPRWNTVLYNGTLFKLTPFQKAVMDTCTKRYQVRFMPLAGYTRDRMLELFRGSKLYIDFGEFSGRERIPREAALCGCCVLTSRLGCAGYYEDVAIPDEYKFNADELERAVEKVAYILTHYNKCKGDFDSYRNSLKHDREIYPEQVKELCNEIFNHSTSI